MVLERAAGQVVLVAASAAVLLAAPPVLPLPRWLPSGSLLAGAVTVGAHVPAVALMRTLTRRRAAPGRWAAAVRRWAGDVRRGLGSGTGFLAIVLASAVVLAGHLATFLVAARVAGSAVPFARLAPLLLLALLAMSLPLNIGGWGPREGASAWAFAAAGLNADQGLTVAVVYGLFALAASLPGAAVLAARCVTAAATPQQVQRNR